MSALGRRRPGRPVDRGRGEPRVGDGRGGGAEQAGHQRRAARARRVPLRVAAHGRLRRGLPGGARRGRARTASLQGLLEVLELPYVGLGRARERARDAQARRARRSSSAAGLPVAHGHRGAARRGRRAGAPPSARAARGRGAARREAVVPRLGHRRRRGSRRRRRVDEVARAIEAVWAIDEFAVVEHFARGREVTCGVLDARSGPTRCRRPRSSRRTTPSTRTRRATRPGGASTCARPSCPRRVLARVQEVAVARARARSAAATSRAPTSSSATRATRPPSRCSRSTRCRDDRDQPLPGGGRRPRPPDAAVVRRSGRRAHTRAGPRSALAPLPASAVLARPEPTFARSDASNAVAGPGQASPRSTLFHERGELNVARDSLFGERIVWQGRCRAVTVPFVHKVVAVMAAAVSAVTLCYAVVVAKSLAVAGRRHGPLRRRGAPRSRSAAWRVPLWWRSQVEYLVTDKHVIWRRGRLRRSIDIRQISYALVRWNPRDSVARAISSSCAPCRRARCAARSRSRCTTSRRPTASGRSSAASSPARRSATATARSRSGSTGRARALVGLAARVGVDGAARGDGGASAACWRCFRALARASRSRRSRGCCGCTRCRRCSRRCSSAARRWGCCSCSRSPSASRTSRSSARRASRAPRATS